MADNLDDGEFWLPSQFLTDDDILEDFKSEGFTSGFGSGSSSDLGSLSTETETSDDDELLLPGFRVKAALPSGSPQSTLYGWEYTRQGSSQGSPTGVGPVSAETEVKAESEEKNDNAATLDLLNKAAGEVAKMKMRSERSTGTGFFDCSNSGKGLLCPPSPQTQTQTPTQALQQRPLPVFQPPFYSYPHFRYPPHMMYGAVQLPPPQQRQTQNRATKNNATNNKTNNVTNNRPLGLPPSAWPPLPGQAQSQAQTQPPPKAQPQQPQVQPMMGMYAIPQGVSVGTGVFLPRVVTVIPEPKKKSDGNVMKTKNNNKGSHKRNSRPTKANDVEEIQLPSEWVY